MTSHALPVDPVYAFSPADDSGDERRRIQIVFENMSTRVDTTLVALTLSDAERLCDRLNARLGLGRAAWSKIARSSTDPRPAGRRPLH